MTQLSRREMLAAGLATLSGCGLSGCGRPPRADIIWRLGTNLPFTHPLSARIKEAADRIYVRSNQRLLIQVYPAGQLGSDADMLAQVRAGAIHMLPISGLTTSMLVPVAALSGIGFAFRDREQVFAAMDGNVGQHIRDAIARHGLVTTPKVFESGFRQITTSLRPVRSPDDLREMKIRVPIGALWTSMFRSFGASPTSINFNEVFTALQTRVVEGQENPLAVVDSGKLYEVQRYCAITNHMWDGFWLLQNQDALRKLPVDLRDLVQIEMAHAADRQREDLAALGESLPAKMVAEGMILNRPDPQPFRETLRHAGFYSHWRSRLGDRAWTLLEDVVGRIV